MHKSKKSWFFVFVHEFWWHNPVNILPYDSGNCEWIEFAFVMFHKCWDTQLNTDQMWQNSYLGKDLSCRRRILEIKELISIIIMWVTVCKCVCSPWNSLLWCHVLKNQQFWTLPQRIMSHFCAAPFQLRLRFTCVHFQPINHVTTRTFSQPCYDTFRVKLFSVIQFESRNHQLYIIHVISLH